MEIRFTEHAERKFEVLRRHGFQISKEDVIQTLRTPEKVSRGWKGRLVERDEAKVVVMFYPARRERYEG